MEDPPSEALMIASGAIPFVSLVSFLFKKLFVSFCLGQVLKGKASNPSSLLAIAAPRPHPSNLIPPRFLCFLLLKKLFVSFCQGQVLNGKGSEIESDASLPAAVKTRSAANF